MLKLTPMSDPGTKNGEKILTAFYGCNNGFDVSKDIKECMAGGLSYEDAVRELIDELKNLSGFNKSFLTEENIEIIVKQAIEDKEWLLKERSF